MADAVKNTAQAVKDKASEVTSAASYEANKATAKDSNQSVGDRVSSGVEAVKDKVDEKKSELSKEGHKQSAENEAKSLVDTVKEKAAEAYNFVAGGEDVKGLVEAVKEKATEAYNYVAEKVSEAAHAVTGDTSKEVANDSNQSPDASAAVKDKVDQAASGVKAAVDKQN